MCFVNETATTEIYTYLPTLSLHDALPISLSLPGSRLHGFHQGRVATPPENTRKLSGIQGVNPRLTDDFIREEAVDERGCIRQGLRSEEHTSELQSLMRISYAVFCLKTNNYTNTNKHILCLSTTYKY